MTTMSLANAINFTSFFAAQATEHGDTGLVLKRIGTRTLQSATVGFSYSQDAASDVGTRSGDELS